MNVEDHINRIIANTLGIGEDEVDGGITREKSKDWDSFNHLMIISEVEREIGVKFSITEVEMIKGQSDIVALVNSKKND